MLEIYDCTLREGEQAGGVHFSIEDRMNIVKTLDEFGMDFIEVGWPIQEEVLEAFLKINPKEFKSKIVAFGSTSIAKNPEEDKNLEVILGIHIHNDSGLAFTNSLESLDYVSHMQGTINGLGERVGNLDFCEFLPFLMLKKNMQLNFKLNKLKQVSDLVYRLANLPRKINQAFISERAFSHKGGVHIDATSKGASYGHITPEVLGMNHSFILTSLGGAACVISAAKKFGFELDKRQEETKEKIKQILVYLRESEKKGYDLGNIEAEQYMIINKYFGSFKNFLSVKEWSINTNKDKSSCYLKLDLNGEEIQVKEEVHGGPVNAIYQTLIHALSEKYGVIKNLILNDYWVRIVNPKSDASPVRTRIDFLDEEKFSTIGVSENIIQSSLEALEKAINYYLNKLNYERNKNGCRRL